MDAIQNLTNMLLRTRPDIQNNPQKMEYINVILSGDSKRGIELANNLCQSFNTPPEQAAQMAKQYFHI